jgi:glutamyl/glutaminyl-tRNA synthetase
LPPIMGPDGKKKLGKRDGAKDILDYKKEGMLPEAMINFLALIGWNPGTEQEIFSVQELISSFDIEKIQVSGGKFNEEKLLWINKQHINQLGSEVVQNVIKEKINTKLNTEGKASISDEMVKKLVPIIIERIHSFGDIDTMIAQGELDYVLGEPVFPAEMIYWKGQKDPEATLRRLNKVIELLKSIDENAFKYDIIKDALWEYASAEGRGEVLWPTRVALSGKEKSPDPFILAELLGKEVTLTRLTNAVEKLSHA